MADLPRIPRRQLSFPHLAGAGWTGAEVVDEVWMDEEDEEIWKVEGVVVEANSVEMSTTVVRISRVEVSTTVVRISRVEIIVVSTVDAGALTVTVDADAEAVTVMIDAEAVTVTVDAD
jgi:hypothetical protein